MVDEFELRNTARDLIDLYRELDQAKGQRQIREARVTRPTPGPTLPVPTWALSLEEELTSRLFEMLRECANHVQPTLIMNQDAGRLLTWLAFHAQPVSELDVAPDLLEELHDQVRVLTRKLRPAGVETVRKRLEPYHRAEVICQRLARLGHKQNRDSLRKLAERSQGTDHPITTEQYGGRTTYRFTEVMAYLTRDD